LLTSLLTSFSPTAVLDVNFKGVGSVSPGQNLTIAQVKTEPVLTVTPANSSVTLGNLFTLAMVDADIVGTDDTKPITRHWLVNGVTLDNSTSPDNVTFTSAKTITNYAGPFPAAGSGSHRYVILLYTQPSTFTAPANLSSTTPVGVFDFPNYVKSTGLEGPVAGMYIQVENGVATSTVSSTAAVVSSTLGPAAAASGGASGSGSGSAGSSSPSPTGGSQKLTVSFGFGVMTLIAFLAL